MPVALSPPPFPTADTAIAAATDSTSGATSIPADAFALMLLAAGGDPDAIAGKDAGAAMTRGRLFDARGVGIIADEKGASAKLPPRDPLLPADPAKRDTTAERAPASSGEIALDPAAMTAALSAAIASGLKTDAPPPHDAAAATSGGSSDRPHAVLQSGQRRVDPDALSAAPNTPTSTSTIAARASETFAVSGISKDLLGEPATKLKEMPDAGGSSVSAQAITTGQLAPSAAPTTVHTIDTLVTAPGWESEFAGRLTQVVMLRNDRAEFHLHPAELGPIDVQISFASDQAVVLITAAHATTRDALEQALPYLRDMLADQGITLGQASVQGERNPADPGSTRRGEAVPHAAATSAPPDVTVRAIQLRGLVDVFA